MIENDNIRDQKSFDKWVKSNLNQQGGGFSNRIDAQIRSTNENNDRLDLQASERESKRGLDYQNSQGHLGTGSINAFENEIRNATNRDANDFIRRVRTLATTCRQHQDGIVNVTITRTADGDAALDGR